MHKMGLNIVLKIITGGMGPFLLPGGISVPILRDAD